VNISIKTEGGLVLKEITDEAEKGLNFKNYDMSIDGTNIKPYQDELSKTKKMTLTAADSKKVYLQPGKYTVEVTAVSGAKSTQQLTVVTDKRGQVSLEPEAEAEPEEPEMK
jgi:hypothetical protein